MRVIIPGAAGGPLDLVIRAAIEPLAANLGRPVEVVNVPGEHGENAVMALLDAPADGHTILAATPCLLITGQFLPGFPRHPRAVFAPITRIGIASVVLAVSGLRPWRNVADLMDAAHARPGELRVGTSGVGTTSHLHMEHLTRFMGLAGFLRSVHFEAGQRAQMQALAAGEIDMVFNGAPALMPLIRDDSARAIAVGSRFRSIWTPELRALPAIGEIRPQASPDAMDWCGMVARAGTPPGALRALNTAFGTILELPGVRDALMAIGVLPNPDPTPADFAAFWDSEVPARRRLIEGARFRAG